MECEYSTPCEGSIFAQIRQLLGDKKEKVLSIHTPATS
jgi:hypothetical protein